MLEDCGLLTDDYHDKAKALQLKYYPMEVDPHLDEQTRLQAMIEWVTKAHDLLLENKLTKPMIAAAAESAVSEGRIKLRDKVVDFVGLLQQQKIPLLIFSAGIADVLEEVLKCYVTIDVESMDVISNRCQFDSSPQQLLTGFDEPLLHVFNKRSTPFLHTDFFTKQHVNDRKNLVLIGDSLGDVTMSEGMSFNQAGALNIGFLNDRVERLEQYLQKYDLVVLGDPPFTVPLELMRYLLDSKTGNLCQI